MYQFVSRNSTDFRSISSSFFALLSGRSILSQNQEADIAELLEDVIIKSILGEVIGTYPGVPSGNARNPFVAHCQSFPDATVSRTIPK